MKAEKAEIVVKKAIKREKGYLYFVDYEGSVCRYKMNNYAKSKLKRESKKESVK